MRAAPDCIEMWVTLSSREAIPGAYVVQQCFRLSGETNVEWRHHVALVTELSEYDLWAREQPPRSLTYVRQGNAWLQVSAVEHGLRYDTPAGDEMRKLQASEARVEAGGSRTVWGKVYWLRGAKDDLLDHWRRDFPLNQPR